MCHECFKVREAYDLDLNEWNCSCGDLDQAVFDERETPGPEFVFLPGDDLVWHVTDLTPEQQSIYHQAYKHGTDDAVALFSALPEVFGVEGVSARATDSEGGDGAVVESDSWATAPLTVEELEENVTFNFNRLTEELEQTILSVRDDINDLAETVSQFAMGIDAEIEALHHRVSQQ